MTDLVKIPYAEGGYKLRKCPTCGVGHHPDDIRALRVAQQRRMAEGERRWTAFQEEIKNSGKGRQCNRCGEWFPITGAGYCRCALD